MLQSTSMRQKQALNLMISGANIFLTGAPGSGKTHTLNEFVTRSKRAGKRVAVTASTGIAASHIGGSTIHSWSGLGILDSLSEPDLQRFSNNDRLLKRYNSTDILVIDEVSMLHGERLNMVNMLAKVLRSDESAFGGMQVVLVGDLFQLPPVSRNRDDFDFINLSDAWHELDLKVCYLSEQHRQSRADNLLKILEAIRDEQIEEIHLEFIEDSLHRIPDAETVITRLYAHNIDVDTINIRHLEQLPGKTKVYEMLTKGNSSKLEQLTRSLLAPAKLELKVGAEVMFVANNFGEGFVNGSRGTVVKFIDTIPVVQMVDGKRISVVPHSWSLNEDGRVQAEVKQLPLRLAWAITIHKSQGMSLDAAEIDLSQAFTPGMGYVALSRVKRLDGLYLRGINQMALRLHPSIREFDAKLRMASEANASNLEDVDAEEFKPRHQSSSIVDEKLFLKLKKWRTARAKKDKLPPYIIAHDSALSAIATLRPTQVVQLLGVPGFGQRKTDSYGQEIVNIINKHK
ncbi:MAG: hypothetical protein NVS1B10_01230 [Candidatus Saccharimonadales bacterium]